MFIDQKRFWISRSSELSEMLGISLNSEETKWVCGELDMSPRRGCFPDRLLRDLVPKVEVSLLWLEHLFLSIFVYHLYKVTGVAFGVQLNATLRIVRESQRRNHFLKR